jgi:hypothetical protein
MSTKVSRWHNWHRLLVGLGMFVSVTGFFLFINTGTASAAPSIFPDNADTSFVSRWDNTVPVEHDIFIDVAYNTIGGLDAPEGFVGIYMEDPNQDIQVLSAGHSCAGDAGSRTTDYTFYYYDGTMFQAYATQNSTSGGCDRIVPRAAGVQPRQIGSKTYYPYLLYYNNTAGSGSSVNAFKLYIPNGKISHLASDGFSNASKFSLQDRNGTGSCNSTLNSNCRRSTFKLKFGTDCKISGTENKRIYWYDDDGDNPNRDDFGDGGNVDATLESNNPSGQRGIRIRLFNETTGMEIPITTTNGFGNIAKFGTSTGGQTNDITFQANHKYRMEWEAVSKSNGIQFQLPYDGIFHETNCQSSQGAMAASCTRIWGWAVDASAFSSSLQVDIYTEGSALSSPVVGMSATPSGNGYWQVGADGGVFTHGDARYFGSTGGIPLNRPMVGIEPTPSGDGYWLVAADGGVFAFGNAVGYGSIPGLPPPNNTAYSAASGKSIVGISRTPTGNGYWLVGSDGGVFGFGPGAGYYGSAGQINPALPPGGANSFVPNRPMVGIESTLSGNGYWMVAADGGIFAFGDAGGYGSVPGLPPPWPTDYDAGSPKAIVGMTRTPSGNGYWLVGNTGDILTFGDAGYFGSLASAGWTDIVGMAARPSGDGYWINTSKGAVGFYGSAKFHGSLFEQYLATTSTVATADPDPTAHTFEYFGPPGSISNMVGSNVIKFSTYARPFGAPGKGVLLSNSPVSVGPCNISTSTGCAVTVSPPQSEVNVPPTFTASIGYSGAPPSGTLSLTFTAPGVPTTSVPSVTYTDTGASLQATHNGTAFSQPADYTVRVNFTGTFSQTCTNTFQIVTKPYARFYGGDVRAGAEPDCQGWTDSDPAHSPDSNINGYYNPTQNKGMGVQLAAFAAGNINGFSSAFSRASAPLPAKGLSFSNTGGDATYGGAFAERFCPPDYFGRKPSNAVAIVADNINLNSLADGNHEFQKTGDLIVKGRLDPNRRVAIYVEGNVLIKKAPELVILGGATSRETLPSLYIVVKGNIYVENDTSNMDGIFIAQPQVSPWDDNTGHIYTCSDGLSTNPSTDIKNQCASKLTVNGAMIARRIHLFRSNSTVSAGTAGEASDAPTIAESMIFSPEFWMAPVPDSLRDVETREFDSITSLPPIL